MTKELSELRDILDYQMLNNLALQIQQEHRAADHFLKKQDPANIEAMNIKRTTGEDLKKIMPPLGKLKDRVLDTMLERHGIGKLECLAPIPEQKQQGPDSNGQGGNNMIITK